MRILITGATGLVGKRITQLLHQKGIFLNYLTTKKRKIVQKEHYRGYYWDPAKGEVDPQCLSGVGAIINLSGENIFQVWTPAAKKRILNSRTRSLGLLRKLLTENEHQVGQLVSASGISIYPSSTHRLYYENELEKDSSFMGEVVRKWESAADELEEIGIKIAKVRTGIVLSNDGGALPQMRRPFRFGVGTAIGSGRQWQSWIHIEDLARIYIHIVEHGLSGTYNAVAPNPVTNQELMEELARAMNKKIWLPRVPPFMLRLVYGEKSSVVLASQLVSSAKIQETGFEFRYVNVQQVFLDLWKEREHKKKKTPAA